MVGFKQTFANVLPTKVSVPELFVILPAVMPERWAAAVNKRIATSVAALLPVFVMTRLFVPLVQAEVTVAERVGCMVQLPEPILTRVLGQQDD